MNAICSQTARQVLEAIPQIRSLIEREFARLQAQQPHIFRLTLNEAEALAWQTGFPQLVFPTLAAEKIRAVADWNKRQQVLRSQESPAAA